MNHDSRPRLLRALLATLLCAALATPALAVVYGKKKRASTPTGTTPPNSVSYTQSQSLAPFYTGTGSLVLSVDGVGTVLPFATVQVEKPDGGVVQKAFLITAATGYGGYEIKDGDVSLDGVRVVWTRTTPNAIGSWNALADVTDLVRSKIDAAPPGRVTVEISEANTESIDGSVLAVVFETGEGRGGGDVALYFGSQGMEGDGFAVDLSEPIPADMAVALQMGVAISYGLQASITKDQFTAIEVNGRRLSTSAGGSDDGSPLVGALITVGGIDDGAENPSDAFAAADNLVADDELYDLTPFVAAGDTRVAVKTASPSGDENLFFASFVATRGGPSKPATTPPAVGAVVGAAAVAVASGAGDRVVLSASSGESKVGADCQITATLTRGDRPVANADVRLQIISGPHSGVESTARTGADGRAMFLYRGLSKGKDLLVAVVDDREVDVVAGSNVLLHAWVDELSGAFIDITPGVCPSVVSPQMQDLMTVALVGSDNFFVEDVDVATLRLGDASPTQILYRDASRPAEGDDCPCADGGGDGYLDLVLRFKVPDVVGDGGPAGQEETRQLTLTGKMKSGSSFEATNCVLVSNTDRPVELPNDVLSPAPLESIERED